MRLVCVRCRAHFEHVLRPGVRTQRKQTESRSLTHGVERQTLVVSHRDTAFINDRTRRETPLEPMAQVVPEAALDEAEILRFGFRSGDEAELRRLVAHCLFRLERAEWKHRVAELVLAEAVEHVRLVAA